MRVPPPLACKDRTPPVPAPAFWVEYDFGFNMMPEFSVCEYFHLADIGPTQGGGKVLLVGQHQQGNVLVVLVPDTESQHL